MRVLYIHPFAVYGGATKSLFELVDAMPKSELDGVAIAPAGQASVTLSAAGLQIIGVRGLSQWDDTRFGHYRNLRWLILLREIGYLPSTLIALRRAARSAPFDLIHCNEITAIFVGVAAKRIMKAPLLVHVRSLQRGDDGGKVSRFIMGLLRRHADAVVAIDEAVRRTLPASLDVNVIHNCMKIPAQLPSKRVSAVFTVALIGVLHRSKGVYEFVAAAKLLRDRGFAVKLLVVGENSRTPTGLKGRVLRKLDFARDVRKELEAYVAANGLEEVVEFTGFIKDIRSIYSQIDAVCFPSHLDAPGRPVFEAALYGLPTIVAMRRPTADVVVHGETGVCIDEPRPQAIADAIASLAMAPARAREMGEKAREKALLRFDSSVAGRKIWSLYQEIRRKARTAHPVQGSAVSRRE